MPHDVAVTVDSSRRGSAVRRTPPLPPEPGPLLSPGSGGMPALVELTIGIVPPPIQLWDESTPDS